ncbi:MAG TPA: hypothetical protein VKQ08_10240 [Cyclobacteriaceae bacterium]|nr:hypothetical protein [Cyclobacteriaceae bacterium]
MAAKKNVLACLSIFLVFSASTNAQPHNELSGKSDYIIYAKSYKKGIYRTFDEFKNNRPSIHGNYTFDNKNIWLTDSVSGRKRKVNPKEIWGYCDGSKIIVSWNKYNVLSGLGRYCYFGERRKVPIPVPILTTPTVVSVPKEFKMIINFNTGNVYYLSASLMRKILKKDDPELLAEFMKEESPRRKLFDYIVRYNERNSSRIK